MVVYYIQSLIQVPTNQIQGRWLFVTRDSCCIQQNWRHKYFPFQRVAPHMLQSAARGMLVKNYTLSSFSWQETKTLKILNNVPQLLKFVPKTYLNKFKKWHVSWFHRPLELIDFTRHPTTRLENIDCEPNSATLLRNHSNIFRFNSRPSSFPRFSRRFVPAFLQGIGNSLRLHFPPPPYPSNTCLWHFEASLVWPFFLPLPSVCATHDTRIFLRKTSCIYLGFSRSILFRL